MVTRAVAPLRRRLRAKVRVAAERRAPIHALASLLDDLHAQGIRYCQWKSNIRLERSLRGLTDLDLLIQSGDLERFVATAEARGLKRILPPPALRFPGMTHYLGFDPDAGHLFHLHVHEWLVLGEHSVKDYRLPMEAALLETAQPKLGVMVPAPELEIGILAVRILLKTRWTHLLSGAFGAADGGVPEEFVVETDQLWGQTSPEEIRAHLERHAPFLPARVLVDFLQRLVSRRLTWIQLARFRRLVVRELAPFKRTDPPAHSPSQSRQSKQVPERGGLTIALLGADGSGKSTQSAGLRRWLSWRLETRAHYMGSKRPSLLTRAVERGFDLAKGLSRGSGRAFEDHSLVARLARAWTSLWHALYCLALARDRLKRARAGRREANAGAIVIFDRYPVGSPMDGPQIGHSPWSSPNSVTRALGRLEARLYARMPSPDRVLVLHVHPHVSLDRKPHRRPEKLHDRSNGLRRVEWDGAQAAEIDANRPLELVAMEIKRAVWGWL